jgi:hypothetical protein
MLAADLAAGGFEAITHPSFSRSGPMDCPFFNRKVSQRTSAMTLLISVRSVAEATVMSLLAIAAP